MPILLLKQENKKLFRANEDSQSWKEYIDYIDDKVMEGFFNVVRVSLEFLTNNMHAEVRIPLKVIFWSIFTCCSCFH